MSHIYSLTPLIQIYFQAQLIAYWTLSFFAISGVIFSLYPFLQRDYTPNIFKSSLYVSSSKAIFNLGIGWIIYACIYGYGGEFSSSNFYLTIASPLHIPIWKQFKYLQNGILIIYQHQYIYCYTQGVPHHNDKPWTGG